MKNLIERDMLLIVAILSVCFLGCSFDIAEKDILMLALGGFIGALRGKNGT